MEQGCKSRFRFQWFPADVWTYKSDTLVPEWEFSRKKNNIWWKRWVERHPFHGLMDSKGSRGIGISQCLFLCLSASHPPLTWGRGFRKLGVHQGFETYLWCYSLSLRGQIFSDFSHVRAGLTLAHSCSEFDVALIWLIFFFLIVIMLSWFCSRSIFFFFCTFNYDIGYFCWSLGYD